MPLAFPLRHPEAFLAPQALDLLAVHGPALRADGAPGETVAPERMLRREPAQPLAQRINPIGIIARLVALGGAVLPWTPAADQPQILAATTGVPQTCLTQTRKVPRSYSNRQRVRAIEH